MPVKKSRVLQKLRSGGAVNCFGLNLGSARIAEMAAMWGFDCLWLKMEHIASDWFTIEEQIKSAKLYGADTMVRVSRGSYSDYIKPLELDATGIMVPHVMNKRDADEIVRITRFHPLGRRPIDGGNADGGYANTPIDEYIKTGNEERFVVIQIEDHEAMAELEDICGVGGIDIIFFGSADYSHSIGKPGMIDCPEVMEAQKRVAKTAGLMNKYAGIVTSMERLEEVIEQGFRFIVIGGDVRAININCRTWLEEFNSKVEKI